jgi:PAS domain S-box-containing protein
MVTISGSLASLGLIQSVNSFATRLFGHTPVQLERRNISMLLPHPIAEMHDDFLRRYLESGVGRMVDYTRIVMGLHKQGYVFPMLMSVRETAMPDGSLAFVGIMRAVPSSEHLIVLDSDQRVTACSLESFGLLGLQAEELASGSEHPQMSHWVAEWDAIQDALTADAGTTMLVMQQRDGAKANSPGRTGVVQIAPNTSPASSEDSGVWIQAFLQRVSLPGAVRMSILYWKHLSTSNKYAVRVGDTSLC